MALLKHWQRVILTVALILGPVSISFLISSCDTETPIWEISGQQVTVLKDGNFSEVEIWIFYVFEQVGTAMNKSRPSLFETLQATSPAPPIVTNKILSVSLISDQEYDALHPAGTDLQDFLVVSEYDGAPQVPYPYSIGENQSLYIALKSPPVSNLLTKLTIITTLDNGIILESETNLVTINK